MSAFGRSHQYPLEARTTGLLRPAHAEPTHHRLRNSQGDLLVSLDYLGLTGALLLVADTPDEGVERSLSMLWSALEHAPSEYVTLETNHVQAGVARPAGTPTHTIDEWVQELHQDLSATRDGRTPVEILDQQTTDWGGA